MLGLVLASAIALGSSAKIESGDHNTPAIRDEIIELVNSKKTTWKAARPVKFQNATVAHIKKMLGTILPHEDGYYEPAEKTLFTTADSVSD